ncbi:MAG: RDD family protein [Meiothermus ruber]|uniref:RDD family protein n=1 Tax=Meiothermus ruber TaxID=277 RepID=A0A7C3DDH1_MEIRU|nr:RDD family protein [Meiothermus ruber]
MVKRLRDRVTLRYLARRLLAGLIDLGVLAGLQFGIVRAATALFPPTYPGHYFSTEGLILFGLFSPLAWFTYAVLPLSRSGQTLGKELMGLWVVNLAGQHPTLWQAFVRESLGRWLNAMVLNLGLLLVLWDRDHQALHDMVAETFVV